MLKKIFDRKNFITLLILGAMVLLVMRLMNLTVVNGEMYSEMALNNRIKKIDIEAKRGEIFDRNGIQLAGNLPSFTVDFMGDSLDAETFNRVAVEIIGLLEKNQEKIIGFPIVMHQGELKYQYDLNIQEWLRSNGYNTYVPADIVFDDIRLREQISDDLDVYATQEFLLQKGIQLPISVKTMKYLDEMNKDNFLASYGLPEETPAAEAFEFIRNRSQYAIDEALSREDVLKILTLRYAIKSQGYLAFNPVPVATNVKETTVVMIEELGMDFPGISISIDPIRHYPYDDLGAHILGYLGKISSARELEDYVDQKGYKRSDIIGKVGIEGVYEDVLVGVDGYKYIEVDVYGQYVKDADENIDSLASKRPVAGEDLYLSIDKNLQQQAEASLEKWIKRIQTGGVFDDPFGEVSYDAFPKAESGAAVVVDVSSGEILALANYPSYDLNLFSTGITSGDWASLQPVNPNNPLGARPLYNTATLTAVQPGSTYKMVTGAAAVEQGLDPARKLYSDGAVEIGNNTFGCWLWNDYHQVHGPTDLYKGLEVSCNYYFFNISTGTDYHKQTSLGIDMNTGILLSYTEAFGLGEPSGIEIEETVRGVPSKESKTSSILWGLRIRLNEIIGDFFPQEDIARSHQKDALIREIQSWGESKPSRHDLILKLMELGAMGEYNQVARLADIIKYDYFDRIGWYEADTLNLSIGQGDHMYTPLQMARYIMGIANDGYLYPLTLIRDKNREIPERVFESETMKAIREGMYRVAHGAEGTARRYFYDFPINVGAKTGTAEKEGNIPPADEIAYLSENLSRIDPDLELEAVTRRTDEILKERNEELASYQRVKNESEDPQTITEMEGLMQRLFAGGYLEESVAMRQAIKDLSVRNLTDTAINSHRDTFDSYAWFVGFAPYEDPEIAVVVFIPQGGHGAYGTPIARDIIAHYLGVEVQEHADQQESD